MSSSESPSFTFRSVPLAVLFCWLVFLALSALGGAIMDHYMGWSATGTFRWTIETMVVSFLCALLALATIIGGLAGRSWVVSWMGAVLLACLHTAVMIPFSGESFFRSERWAICTMWPALLLSTCAPLVLMRTIFGWSLARQVHPAIPRWSTSLEDLMTVGIVIASSMTFSQVMLYSQGGRGLTHLLLLMAVFAGVSLLCIPITVYVSFRIEPLWRRVMGWLVLTCLAFIAIFFSAAIVESWADAYRSLEYISIGVPAGCLTVLCGIIALRYSGYQLTYFQSASSQVALSSDGATAKLEQTDAKGQPDQPSEPWLEEGDEERASRTFQLDTKWQARIATAIIVIAAAAGGISIRMDKQKELNFYRQFVDAKINGAKIQARRLSGLSMSPEFQDADLDRYVQYAGDITELSLAGTKVTDAIFQKLEAFPNLEKLDLSRTSITSEGLLRWRRLTNPEEFPRPITELSLADTKVDWASLVSLRHSIKHLDLSGLNITDDQFKQPILASSLRLARNPITDAGIDSLFSRQQLSHLDLTDTNIDGSTLAHNKCPEDLVLDGTQITDATLTAILATGRVRKLSIARTKVTAAILAKLGSVRSLRLGDGLITEVDLSRATFAQMNQLWLNGKQFTGACFQNGTLSARDINLSGSSVSDGTLPLVFSNIWTQNLCLAGTQITDRSVPFLRASFVDLRNTRVTAKSLKNHQSFGWIIVSLDMFTPEELSQLSRDNVHVGYSSYFDTDDLW